MNMQALHTMSDNQTLVWLRRFSTVLAFVALVLALFAVPDGNRPARAQGMTEVTIEVRDRTSGGAVTDFRYIINVDIAHENASLTPPESYSPLVAVGDSSDPTVELPEGKYLVTVLSGPFPPTPSNYKMWGKHFTVDGSTSAMTVTVDLVPNPLPLATLRVRVFHDNHMVNGEDDIPMEAGLEGFHVVISDPVGEVTVDWFGNPICTEYSDYPGGTPVPGTGGHCETDADGMAVIPNIPPGKYEVEVIPPDGEGWVQTTTIEGTHAIDAWLEEGANGYSTEEGFLQAVVWFGFIRPCEFGNTADDCPTNDVAGSNTIIGRIRQLALDSDKPGDIALGNPMYRPWVALNNLSGDDEQVYLGRGNANGTFTIPHVPPGLYQLVYWDDPLDFIIQFYTVQVPAGSGQTIDVGDIGAPRWFGVIKGYAYLDTGVAKDGTVIPGGAGNGFRDCYDPGTGINPRNVATCEPGLANQDLDIRFKDGSIRYATFTDANGYYEFPEYFEWEHFLIWEVGFGRLRQVSTTAYRTDEFGNPIGYPYSPENGPVWGLGGLLQAQLTWAGTTQWIDSGKLPYGPGENGGISGIVFYATTRNEFNPRLAAAEDYEPGVPDVVVNLYQAALDSNGQPIAEPDGSLRRVALLNTVTTDSWFGNLPTDCLWEYPVPGSGDFRLDPQCLELPRTWNQIKDGVFDGGYAFEETCLDPSGLAVTDPEGDHDADGTPNKFDPDLLLNAEAGECQPLPNGHYIVEVVPPPGYRVIREEDQNTDQGDDFVPAIPPPPCAGPLHLVDDPRNPAHGTWTPICDSRYVTLQSGQNAASDFFLMIDNALPPPGMIRGLLVDDLILDLNPDSPLYVEKRGIPNTPVGILDFAGNEITRVYSDENGYWEVLLPSTYTALCPIPSGVCPGMYQVVGNYPGTPDNPDPLWNPNYGTLRLVFEVWPGKTTYADVAIVPTTNLIAAPAPGFLEPPQCHIPTDTPDIAGVTKPFGSPSDGGSFKIKGEHFGDVQGAGQVTLDGTPIPVLSWSDKVIEVEMVQLSLVSAGPHQLLVTNDFGKTSISGITFHVLGAGYNPPQLHVGEGQPYATIQDALDAANDGDLIIVHPGIYYENLIVGKNVKLQGYGPGLTTVDGRFFNFGGMTTTDFLAKLATIPYDGPPEVPMGQVITVVAADGQFGSAYTTQIDGFAIRGGSRVRGNVAVRSQGGAIYAHAYARYLEISNNLIQTNAGNLGGGIVLGQPYVANPDAGGALDNENDFIRIRHNRVLNNGGFSLAGGVAIFNGAEGYEVSHNEICGNYSAEYGGGLSHYGMSPNGAIRDNWVRFNGAFDEGGGLMIAGEQPTGGNPLALSPGSGPVAIERNLIQANLSNDDGGGIRLLQPVDGPITIANNIVVNNLATDLGGGISLDDALDVRIVNNTIAKNISTATAEDADRSTCSPPALGSCPHAAGVSSEPHSMALRSARGLPLDSFSDPVLFNNIIWENEAFYLDGTGALPSAGFIDLEVVGTTTPQFMKPEYSLLTAPYGSGAGNITGVDPAFMAEMDLGFIAVPFAGDPAFVMVLITSLPDDPPGDYHLQDGSPAVDVGAASLGSVSAPLDDFDGDVRPQLSGFDMGADELVAPSPPSEPAPILYFSIRKFGTVPGIPAVPHQGDIFGWNGVHFSQVFSRATAGLPNNADIDALVVVDGDTFYMSFARNKGTNVPGLGVVDDEDIVLYDAGAWSLFFDGSDVGLGGDNNRDVDAFDFLPDGSLILSIVKEANMGLGDTVKGEDLLRCEGTFGPTTTCTWSFYLDGSDIGLSGGMGNIDGVSVSPSGDLYLSVSGSMVLRGVSLGSVEIMVGLTVGDDDVFVCASPVTGPSSSCGSVNIFFDGGAAGLTSLDALDLP